jgi:sugar O-acyltransferase (sialic acid O-acetyltransferase NeuD family)
VSPAPSKQRKLVLVGDRVFAEIAYEYFTHDSEYEVVAFSVERDYMRGDRFMDLPMVPFESLADSYDPADHSVHVAITYLQFNRVRARLAEAARGEGFALASYVSSRAFVWRNVELGEHCFVFEDNTIQPFVRIGTNVVLWSGNHIGHHSRIGDNCFISSHVVVSGGVEVGDNSFLGVNSTLVNDISVGSDCWIGPSVTLTRNVEPGSFYTPAKSTLRDESALERFLSA